MWPLTMALLKSVKEQHFGVKLELSWILIAWRRRGRASWNPTRVTYWLIGLSAPQVHWLLEVAELNKSNLIWNSLNFYCSIFYKLAFLMLALKIRMVLRYCSFRLYSSAPQFVCMCMYVCVCLCEFKNWFRPQRALTFFFLSQTLWNHVYRNLIV